VITATKDALTWTNMKFRIDIVNRFENSLLLTMYLWIAV